METLYWFDYESFGLDVARDRPVQFAGLRTGLDLQPIEPPLLIFSQPSADYLPSPDACLITGISPQQALARGVPESRFIESILAEMARPGTCCVGYNNIRFDDELTRYTLYRNLLDPFAREWQNGNSRWDLLNVARMTRALRPEGVIWPKEDDGRPSLRLERLTSANGIAHGQAHDALCDVRATLDLAVLLRKAQPRLFQFLWEVRLKARVLSVAAPGTLEPFLWCAPRLSVEHMHLGLVVVVGRQPGNPNALITYDLSRPPHQALQQERFDEPLEPNPFGLLHVNRAPAIAPLKALRDQDAGRLGICRKTSLQHLEQLKALPYRKSPAYQQLVKPFSNPVDRDIDWDLYGGFPTELDRQRLREFRSGDSEAFLKMPEHFDNTAYRELCRRFQARNFPETLTKEAEQIWQDHCLSCWTDTHRGMLTLKAYQARIAELRDIHQGDPVKMRLLDALDSYGAELTATPAESRGGGP